MGRLGGWFGRGRPDGDDPWKVEERLKRRLEAERLRVSDDGPHGVAGTDPEIEVVDEIRAGDEPVPIAIEVAEEPTPENPPASESDSEDAATVETNSESDAHAIEDLQTLAGLLSWVVDKRELFTPDRPDPLNYDHALGLLLLLRQIMDGPGWSPEAEESAQSEIKSRDASGDTPDLRVRVDELTRQVAELRTGADRAAVTSGVMGSALRIAAGVFIGATIAGPLSAALPSSWNAWLTEPLKAAIGGGVGAFAAEVTRPIDRWAAFRFDSQASPGDDGPGGIPPAGPTSPTAPVGPNNGPTGPKGRFDPGGTGDDVDPGNDEIGGFDPHRRRNDPNEGFGSVGGMGGL